MGNRTAPSLCQRERRAPRERGRRRRRAGRARGRARARRPGSRRRRSTRRGRRSAAPCRRCPSARAIRRRRPTTASTSRSAASPSTCASSTRIGEGGSLPPARARAAGDRRGRPHGDDRALARLAPSLPPPFDRRPAARGTGAFAACRPADCPTQTFGALLRELGCPDESIDRFWDVFVRPALNLRTDEVSAECGSLHRADGAARRSREASDVILPDAAARVDARRRRRPRARGGRRDGTYQLARRLGGRPRRRCRRPCNAAAGDGALLGEPTRSRSPIVSSTCSSTARCSPIRSRRCSTATRTGSSTVVRSPGTEPGDGRQYLTVVSSGVPELMEIRGRELVDAHRRATDASGSARRSSSGLG